MKSLVYYIHESNKIEINIKARDLDPVEFEKWAEQVSKSGFGATVAKLKMDLVEYIVAQGKGLRTLNVDVMPVSWNNERDPFFGDEIKEILHKHFYFVKSKESGEIYIGSKKKTSPRSISKWLGDDYSGSQGYNW